MNPRRDLSDSELDRLLGGKPDLAVTEREQMLEHVLARSAPPVSVAARGWVWALAAVATLLVLVPAAYLASQGPKQDELTARGGVLAPSFSVQCLTEGQPAPCARGAKLVFQLSPEGRGAFGAVAEVPDGTTLWLFPSADDGKSRDLKGLPASGVLDDAVVLDGPAGQYVVHGVFSPKPLTKRELREALTKGAAGVDVHEARVEVE